LTFLGSSLFSFGFDVRYGLAAKVDLLDPSDQEAVNVDTPKNLIATINLFKYISFSKQMQLCISLGGGAEYLMVVDKEYIGSLGNKMFVTAPKKPFSPLAAAGIGFQYMLSDSLGVALEFQGTYIFRKLPQILISPVLAIVLKF
jgi:hypothetical protein